jgi:hypothetical protein
MIVSSSGKVGIGNTMPHSSLNITNSLQIGDTRLSENDLKKLIQLGEFMDYLVQSDPKVGDLWTAYKAMKRITE